MIFLQGMAKGSCCVCFGIGQSQMVDNLWSVRDAEQVKFFCACLKCSARDSCACATMSNCLATKGSQEGSPSIGVLKASVHSCTHTGVIPHTDPGIY